MSSPFTFRPGTQDEEVYREVVVGNSYELPDSFRGGEVVVDIGANIGAFTYAALTRGAGEVHAFEADRANFEAAARNLRDFPGRASLRHAAVWRSDRRDGPLYFNSINEGSTACGHVLAADRGQPVPAEPLDDLIRDITRGGRRRIDLMKIDCEGSEYPILLTSRLLHLVDRIVGEFHNFASGVGPDHPFYAIPERARVRGYERFTDAELSAHLRRHRFDVTLSRHPRIPHLLGVFRARRRPGLLSRLASLGKRAGSGGAEPH